MPDYDLSKLASRSFEQLVQALALRVISSGVTVFGDGPDGGREASFEGPMDFPSAPNCWDGYLVIQAKFLQRSKNPQYDADWSLKELRKELRLYANPKKARRCPEYYIFATNVVLSAVHRKGTKDRAAEEFLKFQKKVPLKGWAIWDYDQIRTFLDGQQDVRRAY